MLTVYKFGVMVVLFTACLGVLEKKNPYLFLLDFQVFLGFRGNQFVQVAPALRGYLVRRVDLRDQEVLDGCSVD